MLACERWTLTHSSGWAAVLAGLALALLPGAELEVMNASRVAETVADGEVRDDDEDDDGEDEPVWDGELEPEPETEPDGDGDDGALLGLLVGFVPDDAGALGEPEPEELEDGDGDGDDESDGDGDGESDGDGDGDFDGVGVGVDVAAAGRASHVVSVFAAARAETLRLAETAPAFIVPACATPGQPASAPRVRDPPATRLSTAARTCARRMKTALSPLSRLLGALCEVRRRLGDGWV
jgi:hypothetical protein